MSAIVTKIRTRGFWRVVIRPSTFVPDRVRYEALEEIMRRAAVRLRGWDFPHFDKGGLAYGMDFVGSETDWQHHLESWKFFQTGQFVFLGGMKLDWRDQSTLSDPLPGFAARRVLGVIESLWTITEVFELAARLATTPAGAEEIVVRVELGDLMGRELFVDEPRRMPLQQTCIANIESFAKDFTVSPEALLASADELAVAAAQEVFVRFGWRADAEALRSSQAELRRLD